jgi:hypothetical protein
MPGLIDSEPVRAGASLLVCSGPERCSACRLFKRNGTGYCPGCSKTYQQQCFKNRCDKDCRSCSGGKHAFTPGCCGRAPESRRERWADLVFAEMPEYAPEPMDIQCRLIPVIHSVGRYGIPAQFPQIDAWAVPVHNVMRKDGTFPSKNLKRALGLLPHQRLILSTCAPDDYQELLWRNLTSLRLEEYGLDACFPGHYSIYDKDSIFYQFASAKRQQLHALWVKSPFVWFRLGEHIPLDFLQPIRNASSVLIATGQMFSKENIRILRDEVDQAQNWFPEKTAFFFVGGMGHLRGIDFADRVCYQFNSSWLIRGLRGHDMARRKVAVDEKCRGRLLRDNLEEVLRHVYPELV